MPKGLREPGLCIVIEWIEGTWRESSGSWSLRKARSARPGIVGSFAARSSGLAHVLVRGPIPHGVVGVCLLETIAVSAPVFVALASGISAATSLPSLLPGIRANDVHVRPVGRLHLSGLSRLRLIAYGHHSMHCRRRIRRAPVAATSIAVVAASRSAECVYVQGVRRPGVIHSRWPRIRSSPFGVRIRQALDSQKAVREEQCQLTRGSTGGRRCRYSAAAAPSAVRSTGGRSLGGEDAYDFIDGPRRRRAPHTVRTMTSC